MAVSPLLALTCRCDLGSVSAWDTQDVLVMGKGCETIGVPSISDRILQAGAKAEGMPSGHEGLLASLTKEVGGSFLTQFFPLWRLELVKQSAQRTSAFLVSPMSQSCPSVSYTSLCGGTWMDPGGTGRVSMKLALPGKRIL